MNWRKRGRLFKHERVKQDLMDIYDYYLRRNELTAQQFLDESRKAFDLILKMPGIGRRWSSPIPALKNLRVTSISRRFNNYLIFYRPFADGVQILTVLHGARDLPAILQSIDDA
jgi:toxin ParE1/3/4